MSYKLLKEDEQCFHVQHPDGSAFKVAKKGLSGDTLSKIKHMADGGEAGEEDAGTPEPLTEGMRVLKDADPDTYSDPAKLHALAQKSPAVSDAVQSEVAANVAKMPQLSQDEIAKRVAARAKYHVKSVTMGPTLEATLASPENAGKPKEEIAQLWNNFKAPHQVLGGDFNLAYHPSFEATASDPQNAGIPADKLKMLWEDNQKTRNIDPGEAQFAAQNPQVYDENRTKQISMPPGIPANANAGIGEYIFPEGTAGNPSPRVPGEGMVGKLVDLIAPEGKPPLQEPPPLQTNAAGAVLPVTESNPSIQPPVPQTVDPTIKPTVAGAQPVAGPRGPNSALMAAFEENEQQRRVMAEAAQEAAEAQAMGLSVENYRFFNKQPELKGVLDRARESLARESVNAHLEAQQRYDAAERNAEIDRKYQQKMLGLQQERANIRSQLMTTKIDPNRWWTSKSTGQQIMSSIGMILGGYGAGLTGGQNQAFDQINRIIDRDLTAQQLELGKKQNLLSQLMDEGRDLESARETAKAASMEYVAYEIQRQALMNKDFNAQQNQLTIADTIRAQSEQMTLERYKQKMAMEKEQAATLISMKSAGMEPDADRLAQFRAHGWQPKAAGTGLSKEDEKKDKELGQVQLAMKNIRDTNRVNPMRTKGELTRIRAALAQGKLALGNAIGLKGKELDEHLQTILGKPWTFFETSQIDDAIKAMEAIDEQLGIARTNLRGSSKSLPPPGSSATSSATE